MSKVLVIGDSCTDEFIYGVVDRLCPDAPVPVFLPKKKVRTGGMAANVYANLTSLGVDADIITNNTPVTKTRYVEERTNHMIIRVDSDIDKLTPISDIKQIPFSDYSCVIVSDYNKGFLSYDDIQYICDNHDCVFIDTKKIIKTWFTNAFVIKINKVEYTANINAGYDITSTHRNVIITLGNEGCKYNNSIYSVKKVEIKDMSGAGDTFIAGLVANYMISKNINDSIKFANDCATVVVQQKGVTIVDRSLL